MFAGTIRRFGVARSSKKYLFKKIVLRCGIEGKFGGVTTPAQSHENVFRSEVKFCDPLEKFVAYV
jgi:hypothetical protein